MDLNYSCQTFWHFEGVLQGGLCKDGKDIGICGKGALDKINTEGKEWIWKHELDLDGVDSSEDNGRSQGYGGLTKVGGSHQFFFVCCIVDKTYHDHIVKYCIS